MLEHDSPAKGDDTTLRNRKRTRSVRLALRHEYFTTFHGVSQAKFSAICIVITSVCKGDSGITAHLCMRFFNGAVFCPAETSRLYYERSGENENFRKEKEDEKHFANSL